MFISKKLIQKMLVPKNIWIQNSFGPTILSRNNFSLQNLQVKKNLDPKKFCNKKFSSKNFCTKKLRPQKHLVVNGWDIPDMHKCRQDKCYLGKCNCETWTPPPPPSVVGLKEFLFSLEIVF